MKFPHYTFKGQSLLIKALILILLSSAHALLLQRGISLSDYPGYYCKTRIVSFSQVEKTLEAACNGFISTRNDARRPLVFIDDEEVENLIFEWIIPLIDTKPSTGEKRKFIEKIIFNNSCELTDVVYYDHIEKKHKSCQLVPEVSTSTTPEKRLDPDKSLIRCGSLSWDIVSIQHDAFRYLSYSLQEFVHVQSTFGLVDGPWRRAPMKKMMTQNKRSHNVSYQIVINKHIEVCGFVVRHHIIRKVHVAVKPDEGKKKRLSSKTIQEKQSISIVCFTDQKFLLIPPNWKSEDFNPLKRKTLA
ncbi:BgTH12-06157 [Blumeria graminis f. sp. triticale]|uniref:BgTH12-06157 n=1 Tax=Blumeria graminis f. sp. triticale TaxID=1689686 RepID=A0A9W4GGB6_BLUGR|nr:BgTH12-06157 [Blumeria graminis f. sp. triticale]